MPYYKKADYLYGLLDDNKDGKIDGQDNPANDPFVLHVPSQEEYERGHIPGAINIPFEPWVERVRGVFMRLGAHRAQLIYRGKAAARGFPLHDTASVHPKRRDRCARSPDYPCSFLS